MRIDGPQVTSSLSLNGTTITDLNVFVTTGSLNGLTGSYATTGSNLFKGTQTISGSLLPAVDNTYDLGSVTHQFRDLYLSSASLYIDGTKVLGSTAQELTITTDTGQSFKILEAGSDTITLQSGDGNVTLTSSGQGDIVLDPTTGIIGLKGTVSVYTGNKIVSSDGNSIQFGNGIAVTGSIVSTTTSLVSGSSQITYSGLSGVPSDIISGSGQLTTLGIATTGSNTFNGNLTVTGFIDTQELRTTYISSSILYRSGSTKFGDELTDTHSFTGSILISGSISVPGSNLVSGSSQVLNGSGVFSGSAQLPSGIVSSSAQTIANLPSGVVSGSAQVVSLLPSGTVSGSVQIDVMSTTNIARLATTGSNVFTGALTGTSATFSGNITTTGQLYIAGGSNINIGYRLAGTASGQTQWLLGSSGTGGVITAGGFAVRNETIGFNPLTIESTGVATFSRAAMTTQASYDYQNIRVNSGFGGGYTDAKIQSLLAGYDGSIYGTDIGYSYDGTGYSLRFATNDNLTGNPIERLLISSTGAATFSNTINVKGDINIGDYTTNTTLTFQSVNNGASRINFYDANNTEGVYIRNTGIPYGGDLRFGARWDDDEDKVFFNLRQSSAGASYDVRFGLNVNPDETFHVSSNGITASAPSKGWPVYDAELDTNARRFIFQTAGNNGVSTAGHGASTALILGQYFDSRVIITTPGAGSASPSDQGVGRGRDMMIKAGSADNTVGYSGGRLYLNGGMGYGAGGFNANGGHIIMQSLTGSGNVGINDTSPQTKLSINGANYVEMATFACTSAGATTIVTDNSGYAQFSNGTARHLSNSSVFTAVTDGIQILKAGMVHVVVSQDIRTAGTTGYTLLYIQKNKSTISENLITNTNDEWDGINGCTTINVSANDIINFYYSASNITALDPDTWSNYSLIWTSR